LIENETLAPMAAPANPGGFPADVAHTVRREAVAGLALALADLEQWVSLDSPSDDRQALDALAGIMAGRIEGYGASAELIPSDTGRYLHATLEGSGQARVALLGHHDTVFPGGTATARPFALEGDVARGPGVADMKGGLVVAGQVVRLLAAHHRESFGHLELVSVPDEELREGPFRTLDRLRDFDAVLCMECGRPGNGVVTARKGGQWMSIAADGLAAHAGVAAGRGRSALLAACHEVLRAAELDGSREGLSVNPTLLSAGEVLNSVPSHAAIRIDVRGWRADDLDWAVAEVGRFGDHPGIRLRLDPGVRVPPLERSAAVEALFDAAAEIGAALGTPIVAVATGGVSDASWTAELGIPTLDGLGPIGEDDHSPAERIIVSSIADRVALVAGVIATVEARTGGTR
jgi:glutamate carboxypeptidase